MIKRGIQTPVLFFILLSISFNCIAQTSSQIIGKILDRVTKEPVKNASIIIKENKSGTVSNDNGYFSIPLRLAKFTVIISAVGYGNFTTTVNHTYDNQTLLVNLEKTPDETLDEVVVNSTREISRVKSTEMNITKINPELIKRSPLILGEADIIKALTLQPGITTAGEGAGGFNVRGGNADQNLVLVDGAPLFNTSHLLGFFTSVSPDAIQDVTLYKGSMSAQFGGRLSSLLNMKVKSGSADRMRYTTGISPVSARFFVNGPVIKNKVTFTAGLRGAYPNLVLSQMPNKFGDSRASFYDGIIKGEYAFNDDNKISITFYKSYDKFRFDTTTSYNWKSDLVSLNSSFSFSPKLFLKVNANQSRFISGINNLPDNYQFKLTSSIKKNRLKHRFYMH